MIAGIDFSSSRCVDVVLLDDETDAATWHHIGERDARGPFFTARGLRQAMPSRSWWEDKGVWLVGIEDPFSRQSHAAKALGMIAGAIAVLLPPELTVIQLPPAEWKREALGKPNASKREIHEWFRIGGDIARLNAMHWTEDARDAYGIAWAARAINQRAIERGAA